MTRLDEILVKELREEHRDREWVDKNGMCWVWCEGEWLIQHVSPGYGGRREWRPAAEYYHWIEGPLEGTGSPFMEALHYRVTRG